MNNRRKQSFDYLFLTLTMVLVVVGVWLVFDSSFARAADLKTGDAWHYVKLQVIYAVAGGLALLLGANLHPKFFRTITTTFLWGSVLLLAFVMVPGIGKSIAGSSRWIPIGPFHLQPSEVAKLALVLYLADELANKGLRIRNPERLVRSLIPIVFIVGLVVIEDLGTATVAALTTAVMLFVAGVKKRHMLALGGVGAALGALMIAVEPYRLARLASFINPLASYNGGGYQISHSLFALATGGFSGLGFCEGREKFYIPAPQTDMIGATLGEEFGFIGMVALLGLFVWFAARGLSIAHKAKSPYMSLLALGITSMIAFQALVNIAVITSSIPATGVPLPFISYGGSHLIIMLFGVGIVLSVSRHTEEKMEEPEQGEHESSRHRRRDRRAYLSCTEYRPAAKGTRRGTSVRR